MKTILVTAIGSFSADIALRSLRDAGWRVIGCDIYPREWLANSLLTDGFYQAPLCADPDYLPFIRRVCESEGVQFLLPLTDLEVDVLSPCRQQLLELGVTLCISGEATIALCRDKLTCFEHLRATTGLPLIPTRRLADVAPGEAPVPCVLKPRDGRSSQGLHKAPDARHWDFFTQELDPDRTLVQPMIEGRIVTVDVVRDAAEHCVCMPRRELQRTLNGAGLTVETFWDEPLVQMCREAAQALSITGCVNFEWIDSPQGYYFLECNPRFSGGLAFSHMAGYACVNNHMACFTGGEIEPQVIPQRRVLTRKYHEYSV